MNAELFDEVLRRYLADRRDAVPESGPLIAEIERVLLAGGKRLRPMFCYWGHRAAGGNDGPEIMRASGALELLHTFALVHDDVMDRALTRRGVSTTYASLGGDIAILVGDLALVLADDLFTSCGLKGSALERGSGAYARMRQQVIAGQFLDITLSGRAEIHEAEARRVALLKSGRYSIVEPVLIGACLAGATDEALGALEAFAAPLGEAFQLRDDLLGTFGDPDATGKSTESDIRQGKKHTLFARAMASMGSVERAQLEKLWGDPHIDERGVRRARELIESSGARSSCEQLIGDLLERSLTALQELEAPTEARSELEGLARRAAERET